jgi:UDP-N-acetylglucosamine--N-acetylmuramyl-(pentapeptide) pyrophosphoryl-undecaprenol N-acetylglucosamine transferase
MTPSVTWNHSSRQPILLMAGGTGGHVFPALAIAQALQAQGVKVSWLGTHQGLEARVVPKASIDIKYINISGLRGKSRLKLLIAPIKIILAIWQTLRILKTLRPAAVVGMGGFVTGPGGIAAWLLRIPLLIHEQNAIAGLTNRWLAYFAGQIMEAFPNTFPPHYHAVHTGNPLRANIMALAASAPRTIHNPLRILVVGGSLGAQVLNETVPLALQKVGEAITVWHQTGEAHVATMQAAYAQADFPARIEAFIEDMATAYAWADVVICRAGALTISELAQVGVASILIPYPYAVDDHQTYNAQFLAIQGAAILLPQTQLTVDKLANLIVSLYHDPTRLQLMSTSARNCATPMALQQVINLIIKNAYPV